MPRVHGIDTRRKRVRSRSGPRHGFSVGGPYATALSTPPCPDSELQATISTCNTVKVRVVGNASSSKTVSVEKSLEMDETTMSTNESATDSGIKIRPQPRESLMDLEFGSHSFSVQAISHRSTPKVTITKETPPLEKSETAPTEVIPSTPATPQTQQQQQQQQSTIEPVTDTDSPPRKHRSRSRRKKRLTYNTAAGEVGKPSSEEDGVSHSKPPEGMKETKAKPKDLFKEVGEPGGGDIPLKPEEETREQGEGRAPSEEVRSTRSKPPEEVEEAKVPCGRNGEADGEIISAHTAEVVDALLTLYWKGQESAHHEYEVERHRNWVMGLFQNYA